jgi:putative DNA primase/helicase
VTDPHILGEIVRRVTEAPQAAPPDLTPRVGSGSAKMEPSQTGRSAQPKETGRKTALPPESRAALDRRLAFYPLTDLGNAERFRERQRGRLIWVAAMGWHWWDGRRWARDGAEGRVMLAAHETVRAIQDEAAAIAGSADDIAVVMRTVSRPLSEMLRAHGRQSESNDKLNRLAKQAAAYLEVSPAQLDADPFAINVLNGTIFVRRPGDPLPAGVAGRSEGYVYFREHRPEDYITRLAPVEYDPAAPRERWDRFLAEVQPVAAMRRQLAAWRGYSLTGDTSEQKLCVFFGTGQNGKSVFEDVCCYVAGDYAATTPIETFLDEGQARRAGQPTPDLAGLAGVRMLRTSEPNREGRLNEGLIKLATGGEPIRARHLNRDFFEFYPQFKLTLSGNHRPQIRGADEGIWRRVVLVPWSVTIAPERKDPRLGLKLRAEASGVLNWMLDGLCDWLDHGLVLAAETQEATVEYRRDSDQLGRFLEACTERAPGERVQSSVLHDVFCAWCTANALTAWKGRSFSDAMTERGFRKDKSSVMFWLDLRLTKSRIDFVDGEGRPRHLAGGDGRREAFGGDDFVM